MDNVTQSASPMAVTKTYSLTMTHIAKVATLAEMLGVSQGEVMRRAIDMYYAETIQPAVSNDSTQPA